MLSSPAIFGNLRVLRAVKTRNNNRPRTVHPLKSHGHSTQGRGIMRHLSTSSLSSRAPSGGRGFILTGAHFASHHKQQGRLNAFGAEGDLTAVTAHHTLFQSIITRLSHLARPLSNIPHYSTSLLVESQRRMEHLTHTLADCRLHPLFHLTPVDVGLAKLQ